MHHTYKRESFRFIIPCIARSYELRGGGDGYRCARARARVYTDRDRVRETRSDGKTRKPLQRALGKIELHRAHHRPIRLSPSNAASNRTTIANAWRLCVPRMRISISWKKVVFIVKEITNVTRINSKIPRFFFFFCDF